MRELAIARGVPAAASSAENRSQSTLQNALLSDQALRLLRETAAWWFNAGRIGLWYGLALGGVAEPDRIELLR